MKAQLSVHASIFPFPKQQRQLTFEGHHCQVNFCKFTFVNHAKVVITLEQRPLSNLPVVLW